MDARVRKRRFALLPRGRRAWVRFAMIWGGLLAAAAGGTAIMILMPGRSYRGPLPPLTDVQREVRGRLQKHVWTLADTIGNRNLGVYPRLQLAAAYVESAFIEAGYAPARQEYSVGRQTPCNIEAELRGAAMPDEIVVVGGHYDSVFGCPGANDNATGTAGVLEISRLLRQRALKRTVRFVAFVNEEPPWFQTKDMGSLVYARRCRERDEDIVGMISLETIGCYRDEPGTQKYPAPFSWCYPDTGNFIAFVGNLGSRSFVRRVVGTFRRVARFPSEGVAAPQVTGIGWSDHWSFWQCGYPALMATDTAPFRYPHYHQHDDTPDKVDYERTARVVVGIADVVEALANE